MTVHIGCVVEGHGEVESVPVLVRRIAQEFDLSLDVRVHHPVRRSKSKLLQPGELEKAVQLAAINAGQDGAVVVILDADEDCPASLSEALRARARTARPYTPSAVVLAKCEFECWFLAAAESLRGFRGFSPSLNRPNAPEDIRGAKEWLEARSGTYAPTVDQLPLTARFNLQAARSAPSFDKCYREIVRLLTILRDGRQTP